MLDAEIERRVCELVGASSARAGERIQSLWSGYGEIRRVQLDGAAVESVVVKVVRPPSGGADADHARGWNTDRSHQRKLRSYDVERAFYADYAPRCDVDCRVPRCLDSWGGAKRPTAWVFVLEDLDAAGFPGRRGMASDRDIRSCLRWLAHFHATFLGQRPAGLWKVGTYWHLATRPDELGAMGDRALRAAAAELDARLSGARFRTLVHGDAKVANFCFARRGDGVAAVDFQYVGGGCGMKDVAYLFSSCLDEAASDARADAYLDFYFEHLRAALTARGSDVDPGALEAEWRGLYPLAWADFYRFLDGWAPDHPKIHGYSRRMTERALASLR